MKAQTLERFLSQYRPEKITHFQKITVGISNDAYTVTCASGGRYVIRVIRLQSVESVRAEALIQRAMAAHGISTPLYLRLANGESIGQDGPDTFTVSEHVSGRRPGRASLKLVQSLGTVMAKLHNILDPSEIALGYNTGQWLDPRNVAIDAARCEPAIQKRLQPVIDGASHIFNENLPPAIIHGDLAMDNVFAENGRVTTIFDFETAQYAPRILDVAYTYLSFVYDNELEPAALFEALKTGYNSTANTRLTAPEEAHFMAAVRFASAAAAAWCFSRGYSEYGEKFLKAGARTR